MDTQQLAAEARSLRENEALQYALDQLRTNALDALVRASATDADTIRNSQAVVKVIDELRSDIEGLILSGAPRKAPGIA